ELRPSGLPFAGRHAEAGGRSGVFSCRRETQVYEITRLRVARHLRIVQETLRGPVMASLPFYNRTKVVALLDDLPALADEARTPLAPVRTILRSACCLHRRYPP